MNIDSVSSVVAILTFIGSLASVMMTVGQFKSRVLDMQHRIDKLEERMDTLGEIRDRLARLEEKLEGLIDRVNERA